MNDRMKVTVHESQACRLWMKHMKFFMGQMDVLLDTGKLEIYNEMMKAYNGWVITSYLNCEYFRKNIWFFCQTNEIVALFNLISS